MPAKRFTETWLRSLQKKPPKDETWYRDVGYAGFYLRHHPGGTLSFVYRYHRYGKTQPMTLGEWPAKTLEEAHEEHAGAVRQRARGIDPIEERERLARANESDRARRKVTEAITIRNVIAEWAWHYARRYRKRPREAVRLLRVYLGVPWKGRPAGSLIRRDAVLLLDRIVARGSRVMANRVRDLGSQAFTFVVSRDLLQNNPFLAIARPGGEESSKERSLTDDEVKTFWDGMAAPTTKISAQIRLGLKLILVTAQRPGEVAGAAMDEFDVAQRVWTIPAERSKNAREHYVPLTELAIELIEQLRALGEDRPHLLPSAHGKIKGNEPISERALSRALKNNHSKVTPPTLFGIEPFTPHDLRRTAGTQMTRLGIARLHVAKLLNHSDRDDTTAIYDRHHYWTEKQQALAVWERELRAIIAGKARKVVPLKKRQA